MSPEPNSEAVRSKPRILVVEDEAFLGNTLLRMLKIKGYDAALANCGADALNRIRLEKWDLVLSDIDLGDISGLEICRMVCNRPDFGGLPFIMMTGSALALDRETVLAIGAKELLPKPFQLSDLVKHIELHRHRESTGQGQKS